MTKRVITLLVAIVMLIALLAGCEKTETITSEKSETGVGNYELFQTTDVQEYLNFLENFDETKFEIVDISTSMEHISETRGSYEFYMVTYKKIAE